MKLFLTLILAACASRDRRGAQHDEGAPLVLMGYLQQATIEINNALGEDTFNFKWRKRARRQLKRIATNMIQDFSIRNENKVCDHKAVARSLALADEDEEDKALSEECKSKPGVVQMKLLGQQTKAWSDEYNTARCNGKRFRPRFNQRMDGKLNKMKRMVYCKLGCGDKCPKPE